MALKIFKKNTSEKKTEGAKSELTGNTIFLSALLKKFEKELKATGKEFKTIHKIDLSFQVKPEAKILDLTFHTDNGIFKI
jgi:hypothetical protein